MVEEKEMKATEGTLPENPQLPKPLPLEALNIIRDWTLGKIEDGVGRATSLAGEHASELVGGGVTEAKEYAEQQDEELKKSVLEDCKELFPNVVVSPSTETNQRLMDKDGWVIPRKKLVFGVGKDNRKEPVKLDATNVVTYNTKYTNKDGEAIVDGLFISKYVYSGQYVNPDIRVTWDVNLATNDYNVPGEGYKYICTFKPARDGYINSKGGIVIAIEHGKLNDDIIASTDELGYVSSMSCESSGEYATGVANVSHIRLAVNKGVNNLDHTMYTTFVPIANTSFVLNGNNYAFSTRCMEVTFYHNPEADEIKMYTRVVTNNSFCNDNKYKDAFVENIYKVWQVIE